MSVHRSKRSEEQNRPRSGYEGKSQRTQRSAVTCWPFVLQDVAWKRRVAKRPSEVKSTKKAKHAKLLTKKALALLQTKKIYNYNNNVTIKSFIGKRLKANRLGWVKQKKKWN